MIPHLLSNSWFGRLDALVPITVGYSAAGPGSVAADYDMVFAFKTLPMWWKATGTPGQPMPFSMRMLRHGTAEPKAFNEYTGAPLKPPQK